MDAQSFFKKSKDVSKAKAFDTKAIGLVDSLPYKPLTYGFQENIINHNFELFHADLRTNAHMLRQGEIEIGLISPMDYALKKESWLIVPEISLSAHAHVKHVQLFFKKGLKDIKSIAVDEKAVSERILLEIIMREKFMQSPEYIPMAADIDKMLLSNEAALIVGEKALEYYNPFRSRLDLNDEWTDLTGLPFVYSFWAGRDFTIHIDDLTSIQASFLLGQKNLEQISKNYAETHSENWAFYHDYLTKNLSFAFTDHEKEGLTEFYNYAFFYGHSEFIPDLNFYQM